MVTYVFLKDTLYGNTYRNFLIKGVREKDIPQEGFLIDGLLRKTRRSRGKSEESFSRQRVKSLLFEWGKGMI